MVHQAQIPITSSRSPLLSHLTRAPCQDTRPHLRLSQLASMRRHRMLHGNMIVGMLHRRPSALPATRVVVIYHILRGKRVYQEMSHPSLVYPPSTTQACSHLKHTRTDTGPGSESLPLGFLMKLWFILSRHSRILTFCIISICLSSHPCFIVLICVSYVIILCVTLMRISCIFFSMHLRSTYKFNSPILVFIYY